MRFNYREWWGELFRSIVSVALLAVGILCEGLGSLVLIAAFASPVTLEPAAPECQPFHTPPVSPLPPRSEEVATVVEVAHGEGFEIPDELLLLGVEAFLFVLGALLILASTWVGKIGELLWSTVSVTLLAAGGTLAPIGLLSLVASVLSGKAAAFLIVLGGLLCLASKRASNKSLRERLIKAGALLGVD